MMRSLALVAALFLVASTHADVYLGDHTKAAGSRNNVDDVTVLTDAPTWTNTFVAITVDSKRMLLSRGADRLYTLTDLDQASPTAVNVTTGLTGCADDASCFSTTSTSEMTRTTDGAYAIWSTGSRVNIAGDNSGSLEVMAQVVVADGTTKCSTALNTGIDMHEVVCMATSPTPTLSYFTFPVTGAVGSPTVTTISGLGVGADMSDVAIDGFGNIILVITPTSDANNAVILYSRNPVGGAYTNNGNSLTHAVINVIGGPSLRVSAFQGGFAVAGVDTEVPARGSWIHFKYDDEQPHGFIIDRSLIDGLDMLMMDSKNFESADNIEFNYCWNMPSGSGDVFENPSLHVCILGGVDTRVMNAGQGRFAVTSKSGTGSANVDYPFFMRKTTAPTWPKFLDAEVIVDGAKSSDNQHSMDLILLGEDGKLYTARMTAEITGTGVVPTPVEGDEPSEFPIAIVIGCGAAFMALVVVFILRPQDASKSGKYAQAKQNSDEARKAEAPSDDKPPKPDAEAAA